LELNLPDSDQKIPKLSILFPLPELSADNEVLVKL